MIPILNVGVAMNQKAKVRAFIPLKVTIQRIKMIETAPTSSGKRFLLKHLRGGTLTRDQAIKAKCADCSGYYIDGRIDCELRECPLYPFTPYKKKGAGSDDIEQRKG